MHKNKKDLNKYKEMTKCEMLKKSKTIIKEK